MQCNQPNCSHFEFMIIRLFTSEDDTQTIIVSVVDTVDASKCAIHAMERNCYQSKRRVLHVSIWFARLNKVHWLFSFPFYSAPQPSSMAQHVNWFEWREFDVQSVEAIEYKICSISIAIVAIHVYLLHCHCSLHGTQTTTVQTITVVQYSAHRTLWLWCVFVPPLLLLFLLASHCLWKL